MDWTAFIKDNSQALFTLCGVFLGSAITLVGNYLNNRFQAKENDKERLEKRRETKVQLAIEIMKNDIKRIEDVNNLTFEFINQIKILNLKRDTGKLKPDEWLTELQLMVASEKGIVAKLAEFDTITEVLVYIHGEELYSMYNNFTDLFSQYLRVLANPSSTDDDRENAFDKLVAASGKFQQQLRKKLISLRDTE